MLRLDRARGRLWDSAGRRFRPAERVWDAAADGPATGDPVSALAAATWLQRESGAPCRIPVGVIGVRTATPEQLAVAEQVGAGLARMGITVLCGGREGVMAATCCGVAAAGGISVGLLPDPDYAAANPFVTVPIATGIGVARNAVIARAALCLVAVGGGYGTISEAAFGLQFGKRVFGLADAPVLAGMEYPESVEAALAAVAEVLLDLPRGQ